MFHPCLFRENWQADKHFNALKYDWPGLCNFCNPPYSLAVVFFEKALIMFFKGVSSILLIPESTCDAKIVGQFEKTLTATAFKNCDRPLDRNLVLVYLIRPELTN